MNKKLIAAVALLVLINVVCAYLTVSGKQTGKQTVDYGAVMEEIFAAEEPAFDAASAVTIDLGSASDISAPGVTAEDGEVLISEAGVYLLEGDLEGSVLVETEGGVNLILNGVSIRNDTGAAIYARSAASLTVTLAAGSENVLGNAGEFLADGSTKVDGVIFSMPDLYINGPGP